MTPDGSGAALVVLTPAALPTARAVAAALPATRLYGRQGRVTEEAVDVTFTETGALLRNLFLERHTIIAFFSSAIVMRCLAPALAHKQAEPPVLACSADGSTIVPLLGGHRGANRLARQLAQRLGGHAAITTAGDTALELALDAPPAGWCVADTAPAKPVTAALLAGESVRLVADGPEPGWLRVPGVAPDAEAELAIRASDRAVPASDKELVLHPATLAVGLGCARDTALEEARQAVHDALDSAGLAPESVALVASLDVKMDEPAVHEAARARGVPARFFDAQRLSAEEPRLSQPSETVRQAVGCPGVAEGAALAAAGPGAELVVPKRAGAHVTVAIARSGDVIDPATAGRRRGHLAIVGLGPGSPARRTSAAEAALAQAECLVGYSRYLDQLGPWAAEKTQWRFELGAERERVAAAIAAAAEGRDVALVGSGDAGIYGLATLVMETLAHSEDATRRAVAWRVEPGVTAMQMAAARLGGALGHDFCAISLSDLMTPWPTIAARLEAAARGDFVVALYNPTSKRRAGNLAQARAILAAHRPGDTPAVIARNLDRPGEAITQTTLAELDEARVDMLSLVLVGSAQSCYLPASPGQPGLYTPRGYSSGRDNGEPGG